MAATIILCAVIAGILFLGLRHFRKTLRSGCCGSDRDPAPRRIRVKDRDLHHYPYEKILAIDGMACRNCATFIANALNSLGGVYASVDLAGNRAVVYMQKNLPDEILRKTVRDAGYTVGIIRAVCL